jgi:hypothetical protein
MNAFTIHMVNGITTTATYTNHFDDAVLFLGLSEI